MSTRSQTTSPTAVNFDFSGMANQIANQIDDLMQGERKNRVQSYLPRFVARTRAVQPSEGGPANTAEPAASNSVTQVAEPTAVQPSEGGTANTAEPFLTADLPVFPATPDSVTQVTKSTADQSSEGGSTAITVSSSESDPDEEVPLSLAAALAANEEWLSGQRLANALEDESRARSDFAALTAEVTEISRTLIKRDAWDCPEDRYETRARIEALEQEVQRAQDLLFHYEAQVVKAKAKADAAAKEAAALTAAVEEKARKEAQIRALQEAGLCVIGSVCSNEATKLLDGCPFCVECYKHAKANGAVVPSGPLSRKALYQLGEISELDYSLVEPDKPYSAVVGCGSSEESNTSAVQTAEHQQALTERQQEVLNDLREKEDKRQRQADHDKRLEEEKAAREAAAPGRVKHANRAMLEAWRLYLYTLSQLSLQSGKETAQEQNQLLPVALESYQKAVGAALSEFLRSDPHDQQARLDAIKDSAQGSLNSNVIISMLYSPEFIMWMIEFLANYVGMISTTTEKAYAEMREALTEIHRRREKHFDGKLKDPLEEAKFLRMILVMMLGFLCKFTVHAEINENAVWSFSIYFLTDFLGDESVAAIEPALKFADQGNFESASKALKMWMLELTLNVATRFLMEANVHEKSLDIFLHKKVLDCKEPLAVFVRQMKDLMDANGGLYVQPDARTCEKLLWMHRIAMLNLIRSSGFSLASSHRVGRRKMTQSNAKLEAEISAIKSEILTLESSHKNLSMQVAEMQRYSSNGFKPLEVALRKLESTHAKLKSERARLIKVQTSLASEQQKLKDHEVSARAAYVKTRENIRSLLVGNNGDRMVINSIRITELMTGLFTRAREGLINLLDENIHEKERETFNSFKIVFHNIVRNNGDSHAGPYTSYSESGRSKKAVTVTISILNCLNQTTQQKSAKKSAKSAAATFETKLNNVCEIFLQAARDGLEMIRSDAFEPLFEHLRVAGFLRQDAETIAGFIRDAISNRDSRAVDTLKNLIVQVESKQRGHAELMSRLQHLRGGEHC